MLQTVITELSHWNKENGLLDRFEEKHPLLGILLFQAAVGILLIAAVSGIAFAGGGIIWIFYRLVGVM